MIMKQEPRCPSTDFLSFLSDIPNKISVFSQDTVSWATKTKYVFAVIISILLLLFFFFGLDIQKKEVPLSSAVQVEFQEFIEPVPDIPSVSENQLEKQNLSLPMMSPPRALPQIKTLSKIDTVSHKDVSHSSSAKESENFVNSAEQTARTTLPTKDTAKQIIQQNRASASLLTKKQVFPAQRCTTPSKDYPLAARKRHEQGTVKIGLQILPDGQLKGIHLVESSGFSDLDKAAIQSVQSIKCQEVEKDETIVKTTIPVIFQLNSL